MAVANTATWRSVLRPVRLVNGKSWQKCARFRDLFGRAPSIALPGSLGYLGVKPGWETIVTAKALAVCLASILAIGLTASIESDAADSYYRWKDERGRLVVSDRPPADPGIEYEVVSQRTSMARRVRPGEGAVPPEVEPRPGNEFEQVDLSRQELEVVKKNPESCARAMANLETLNTSARIRIRDPETGELRFISEEEKELQRQKAIETIRVHCE